MSGKAGKKWTEYEDRLLLEFHSQGCGVTDIAQALNRPIGGVEHRLALHGLRAQRSRPWSRLEQQRLIAMRDKGMTWDAIARALGRTVEGVFRKFERLDADREVKREEQAIESEQSIAEKLHNAYLARCMEEMRLDVRRALLSTHHWEQGVAALQARYRARCEHDVPPDYGTAKVSVYFGDTRSCVGSTAAWCAEVA